MQRRVVLPHVELQRDLRELQGLIAQVSHSVEGAVEGAWSEAYARAMATFGTGAGADQIKALTDTAEQLARYGEKTRADAAYYKNMIVIQLNLFLVEWSLIMAMAVWNPFGALAEQAVLRATYRAVLRSLIFRFLAGLAAQEVLNVGLAAATHEFAKWLTSEQGYTLEDSDELLKQAVGFGALQGVFGAFVPFVGGALGGLLGKAFGRDVAGALRGAVDAALAEARQVKAAGRDLAGEAAGSAVKPVATDFGRDLAGRTANLARALREGRVDAAGEAWFSDVGDIFARGLGAVMGDAAARRVGEEWARAFTRSFGGRGMEAALAVPLRALPRDMGALRRVLSQDVARMFAPDFGRKVASLAGEAALWGGAMNLAEGTYNAITTGHFTTSLASFTSGAFGALLGHAGAHLGGKAGWKLRSALGLGRTPTVSTAGAGGAGAGAGGVNAMPGPGHPLLRPAGELRFTPPRTVSDGLLSYYRPAPDTPLPATTAQTAGFGGPSAHAVVGGRGGVSGPSARWEEFQRQRDAAYHGRLAVAEATRGAVEGRLDAAREEFARRDVFGGGHLPQDETGHEQVRDAYRTHVREQLDVLAARAGGFDRITPEQQRQVVEQVAADLPRMWERVAQRHRHEELFQERFERAVADFRRQDLFGGRYLVDGEPAAGVHEDVTAAERRIREQEVLQEAGEGRPPVTLHQLRTRLETSYRQAVEDAYRVGGPDTPAARRELDAHLARMYDELPRRIDELAVRERQVAPGLAAFDDLTAQVRGIGRELPDPVVLQARADLAEQLRTAHTVLREQHAADAAGFETGWQQYVREATGDRAVLARLEYAQVREERVRQARELFHRAADAFEDGVAQGVPLGEAGRERLAAAFDKDVERAVDADWFGHQGHHDFRRPPRPEGADAQDTGGLAAGDAVPSRPFEESLDALHAGLPRRMVHEFERQTVLERAGQDFHTLAGHPDSPAHHYDVDEPTLERLGEEFRADTLRVHDRIQTDADTTLRPAGEEELTAWLRHEARHENAFQQAFTTARTTPLPAPRDPGTRGGAPDTGSPRPATQSRPATDSRPATGPSDTPSPALPTTSDPHLPTPTRPTEPTAEQTTERTAEPTAERPPVVDAGNARRTETAGRAAGAEDRAAGDGTRQRTATPLEDRPVGRADHAAEEDAYAVLAGAPVKSRSAAFHPTSSTDRGTAEPGTAQTGTTETDTAEMDTAAVMPATSQGTAGRSRWSQLASASPDDASLLQVHVRGELKRLGHTVAGPLSAAVAQHYDELDPAWDTHSVQRRAAAVAHRIATGDDLPLSRWHELTRNEPDRASALRVLATVELQQAQYPVMPLTAEDFAHAYDRLADTWHAQPLGDQATALAHRIRTGTDLPPHALTPTTPGRAGAVLDHDHAQRLDLTVRAELAAAGHPAQDLTPGRTLLLHHFLDPAWHTTTPGHQAEAVARWIRTETRPGPPAQTRTTPTRPATMSTPALLATGTSTTQAPPAASGATPLATGTSAETSTEASVAGSRGAAPAREDDPFLISEVLREFRRLEPTGILPLPTHTAIRIAAARLSAGPGRVTRRQLGEQIALYLFTGLTTSRPPHSSPPRTPPAHNQDADTNPPARQWPSHHSPAPTDPHTHNILPALLTHAATLLRPPLLIGTDPDTRTRRNAIHHALTQIALTLHTHDEDTARTLADTLATHNPSLRSPHPHLPAGTPHTPTDTDSDSDTSSDGSLFSPPPTHIALPGPSASGATPHGPVLPAHPAHHTTATPPPADTHHTPPQHPDPDEEDFLTTALQQHTTSPDHEPDTRPPAPDTTILLNPPTPRAREALGHLADHLWRTPPPPGTTTWTRTHLPVVTATQTEHLLTLLRNPAHQHTTLGTLFDHLRTTHAPQATNAALAETLLQLHRHYHRPAAARPAPAPRYPQRRPRPAPARPAPAPRQGKRKRIRWTIEQRLWALDAWRAKAPGGEDRSTSIPVSYEVVRVEDPVTGRPLDVPIGPWLNHLGTKGLKKWDSLLVGALTARGVLTTVDGEGTLRITGTGPAQPVWDVGVYLRALTVWRAAAPAGEDRGTRIPPDGTYITLTGPTPTPLTRTGEENRQADDNTTRDTNSIGEGGITGEGSGNGEGSDAAARGADIPVGTWLFQARHVGLTGLTDNEITQLEEAGLRVGEADSTDRRLLQNLAHPGAAAPTTTTGDGDPATGHPSATHHDFAHPSNPAPQQDTTATTPAVTVRGRKRRHPGGQQPSGQPQTPKRRRRTRGSVAAQDETTASSVTDADAAAGQDTPTAPTQPAQHTPGLPGTQPQERAGTWDRPTHATHTDTPGVPAETGTAQPDQPQTGPDAETPLHRPALARPDGTYITLTGPTPTPLTRTGEENRHADDNTTHGTNSNGEGGTTGEGNGNGEGSNAAARGADIPVGTWLFQARHVGLTGLTDNEITQLEEAGLRVGEADSTDRHILQNLAHPGATAPTTTTGDGDPATGHPPATHHDPAHPSNPAPQQDTTATTPAVTVRGRKRRHPGGQQPSGQPQTPKRRRKTRGSAAAQDETTASSVTAADAAAAAAGQDTPTAPTQPAQHTPGLPATQPQERAGTWDRPTHATHTDTAGVPAETGTAQPDQPQTGPDAETPLHRPAPAPRQGKRRHTRWTIEQRLWALDAWRAKAPGGEDRSTSIPVSYEVVRVEDPVTGRPLDVPIGPWLYDLESRGLKRRDSLLVGALTARGVLTTVDGEGTLRITGTGPAQPVWGVGVYLRALTVWRAAAPAGEDRGTRIPPDGTYITLTGPTPTPLTRTGEENRHADDNTTHGTNSNGEGGTTGEGNGNGEGSNAAARGADIPVGTWLFQALHVGLTGLTDNEITQLEEAGLRVGEADSTDRRILQNLAHPGATAPTTTSTQHQPPEKEEELLTWIRTFLLPLGHDGKRLSDSKLPGTRLQKKTRSPDRDEQSKLRSWLHNASNASGRTASPRVRAALEAAAFTVEALPDGKVRVGFAEDSDRYQAYRGEVVNAIRDLLHPLNEDGNRVIDDKRPGTRPTRGDKRFKTGRFDLAEWLQHASTPRGVKVWPEMRAALEAAAFTLKPLPDTDGKVRVHFAETAPGGKAGTTAATAQGAGQESRPEQSDRPGPRTAARPPKRRGRGTASEPRRERARGTNTSPDLGQPPTHAHDPQERAGASDRPAEPANASAARVPAESGDRPEPGMPDPWAGPDAPARSGPATAASPDTFFPLLEDPGRALGSESTQPGVASDPPASAVPTHVENQPDQSGLPGLPGPPDELAQLLGLDGPAQWFGLDGPAQWFGSEQPAAGWPDPGVAESWAGPDQETDPFSLADIDWSAVGVGDGLPGPGPGPGPGAEGPGDAVPARVFDPFALGDLFLPGGPLTAAAEAGPLDWLGPEHSGESFMPWTGTGLPDTRGDSVGLDRPQDGGPAGPTGADVPVLGGPVGDLSGGQWWNSAEQERQWRSAWKEETVDPSVQRAARGLGWTVWQVPPDGDCFFHALIAAGQAADRTPLPESVMVIRTELADEVERVRNILLWTGALPPRQQDDQAEPWWSTVQQSVINILAREAALTVLRPDLFPDPAQNTDAGRLWSSVQEIEQSDAFQDLVQAFTALRADTGVLPEDWQGIADQLRTPGQWNNVSGDIVPVIAAHLYGIHLHTLQIDPRGTNWTLTVGPTHGQPLHLVRHAHHWMPARHHTPTTPQPAPAQPHPADPPLPAGTLAATHQPPAHDAPGQRTTHTHAIDQNQSPNQRQPVEKTRPQQRKSPTQWTDDLILDAIDTWRSDEYPDEEDCTQIPPGEAIAYVHIPNTDRYEDVRIGAKVNKMITAGVKSASRRLVEGLEKRHIHMEEVDGFYRIVRRAGQRMRPEWSIEQFVAGLVRWRSIAGPNGEDRSNVIPNQKAKVVLAVPGSDSPSTVPIGHILYGMLRGQRKPTEADIALLRQHGIHLSEPDNDGRRRVLQDPAPTASGGVTGHDQEARPRLTRQDGADAGRPQQPDSPPRRRSAPATSPEPPPRERHRLTPAGNPPPSVPQGAPTPQPAQQPAAETGHPGITTPEQEQQQGAARDAATWAGEHADEAARQDLEGFGDRPAAHPAAGRTHEGEESRTRTFGTPPADGPSPHTAPRAAADTAPPAGMPADAGTAKHQAMSVEDDIMAQMMGWI
ncbi:hypothetical protein [Streptomyces sp. E-15]